MTTTQVETLANTDGLGRGLNLPLLLRRVCVPELWEDMGEARWKNVTTTLTLTAASRTKDLPSNFGRMLGDPVIPPSGQSVGPFDWSKGLKYIGDDDARILNALLNTTNGRPGAYWLVDSSTDKVSGALSFDIIPDEEYVLYYRYERAAQFASDDGEYNLDKMMPAAIQPGLVKLLRREILVDRLGKADPRYELARGEYLDWLARARGRQKDQARNPYVKRL